MSRILKVMIVLLAIAAMVTPVMAEDRLSMSGQMRVRAFYIDDDTDSTASTIDQRLRTGGKYSIADGVSVTFRFDITESNWGNSVDGFGLRKNDETTTGAIQWDRAHLDLDFGSFKLRAGQQLAGVGNWTIDVESTGFLVTSGPVKAFVFLTDDQGSTDAADDYVWAFNYGQKMDAVKFDAFVGGQNGSDENVYVIGVNASAGFDALTLSGEFAYFTGDASEDVDAMGTQLVLAADFAASETVTVGGKILYAMAADSDGSEVQYSVLGNDFNNWKPLTAILGGMAGEKGMHFNRPFNAFGNAGLIGLNGNAKVKATEELSLAGSLSYLMPEDDDDALTTVDSAVQIVLASSYKLMTNTYLDATLQYTSWDDSDDTAESDNEIVAGAGLFVNF